MPTPSSLLQELCQRGQALLAQTDYLGGERVLAEAEQLAWSSQDWDTLSRLYMPLQECRRQKRQIALEGTIRLNLSEEISVESVALEYSKGEFILPGHGNIMPAIALRRLAEVRSFYLEAFLAAAYTIGDRRAIVVVGMEDSPLPPPEEIHHIDQLIHRVPAFSIVLTEDDLADSSAALATALWERLHLPYLAAADAEAEPIRRMAAYRQTIRVDNACELAHQKLSSLAAIMCRK